MELTISKHAEERYAERIMEKTDVDVKQFIANNKQKIFNDIKKMVEYGELIFTGQSAHEFNKEPVRIYMKDTWVVIVDDKRNNVITLYSIDLGVGKAFNNLYIEKLMDLIHEAQKKANDANTEVAAKKKEYLAIVSENEKTIAEYRKLVKSLEEQNSMYRKLATELESNRVIAEKDLRDHVATLIGKSIF